MSVDKNHLWLFWIRTARALRRLYREDDGATGGHMPGMIVTRGTDERFTIRHAIDMREKGLSLVLSFFEGSIVTVNDLAKIYAGFEVEEEKWKVVKRVLAERMTKT
jgi:hypothetical protein